MDKLYLGILCGILLIFLVIMIWLIVDRFKLKKELQQLTEYVNRNNRDIAGLCSAAIAVDTRLNSSDEQVKALSQKIIEARKDENASQPYYNVIQKIRAGASVAELMQESGVSRDEAVLLIRLHGNKMSYDR